MTSNSPFLPRNGHLRNTIDNHSSKKHGYESMFANLFLTVACLWPLFLFAFFSTSSSNGTLYSNTSSTKNDVTASLQSAHRSIPFMLRDVLDRVDIMGYGPTHPRVAVVLVGDDRNNLVSSLESIFKNTDLNRIFIVCVVADGIEEDPDLVHELKKIDRGAIPHWHGFRPDIHSRTEKSDEVEDDPHGKKVHVMFNKIKIGLSRSRNDATNFIKLLETEHENAGLKSEEEDLILLLLQSGAHLTASNWLGPVTEALIVPPPILGSGDRLVSLKMANAVSFNLEGSGKRTSFDTTFTSLVVDVDAADIILSSGASYPSPALNGAAVALRLQTYMDLPLQDLSLEDSWPTNLDLALNLWLCGDGIDMLKDVEVTAFGQTVAAPLTTEMAARFAAAWMDERTQRMFYNAYIKTQIDLTYLEWQTFQAQARSSNDFPLDIPRKCRSFLWYAENINHNLIQILNASTSIHSPLVKKISLEGPHVSGQDIRNARGGKTTNATAHGVLHDMNLMKKQSSNLSNTSIISTISADALNAMQKGKNKPSKPLCVRCIDIVLQAKSLNVEYEDVRTIPLQHPHRGARDANGEWNYIHNETSLRSNPPLFDFPQDKLKSACEKHDNNWHMLNEKVFVDLEYDKMMEDSGKDRVKLFCLVYTTDLGHDRIPSIRETWG